LGDKIKALKEGNTQIAAFLAQFSSIYPTFIEKLAGQNPELSKTDLLYCASYRIGLSYKEIGQALNIETASVYKRKYRIQGKLGLSNEEELNRVLFSL
jgi:DNA-binding CsgD family transcriptional regulator